MVEGRDAGAGEEVAGPAAVIEAAYSVLEHMLMNLENKIVLAEMGVCVHASERACVCVRS